MKKLFFSTVSPLWILTCVYSQSSWQLIPFPISEDLVSICVPDAAHIYIVSENGTFIRTSNGGITWETFNAWPGIHLSTTCFSDGNHGCSVGWYDGGSEADSSLILVTNDGGDNWTWVDHELVNRFNDVFFINDDKGWAVGSKGEQNLNCIYRTLDGGNTWSEQTSMLIVGAELMGVSFRNESQGSVCGADGAFFITSSGGTSWAMGISMPVLNLNDIFNFGILNGCIVGDDGTALYTTNNWYQYVETTTNTTENLNAVSGDPATNKLWAVGDNGTMIYTPNYLFGWITQESGTTENLNDILMLGEDEGWAVGDNGTLLYYGTIIHIKSNQDKQNLTVSPNPVSGILKINSDTESAHLQVTLFNLVGEKVLSYTIAKKSSPFEVDLSGISPGLYLLMIQSGTARYDAKIVIR